MVFACFFGMVFGLNVVAMRDVRVMPGCFVIAGFVVFGCLAMVLGSVFVMFGGLAVVLSSFFRHETPPTQPSTAALNANYVPVNIAFRPTRILNERIYQGPNLSGRIIATTDIGWRAPVFSCLMANSIAEKHSAPPSMPISASPLSHLKPAALYRFRTHYARSITSKTSSTTSRPCSTTLASASATPPTSSLSSPQPPHRCRQRARPPPRRLRIPRPLASSRKPRTPTSPTPSASSK